jgi:molybdate transport system substrate-binding protein
VNGHHHRSRRTARWTTLALAALLLSACGEGRAAGRGSEASLLVLAASDLQLAFEEIVPHYLAATGERLGVVLGSTGNLAAQIRHGAPADLFLAANAEFVDELIRGGSIDPGSRREYATGRLALVSPPGRAPPPDVAALAHPRFGVVAIANPEHAPYGTAAREALHGAGVWDAVRQRLVLGENVSHAHQFARTGNADAAIVALSLVVGAAGGGEAHTLVPADLHRPLRQTAGVTTGSARPEAAAAFLAFLLSARGQAILARHGFEPPAAGEGVHGAPPPTGEGS